MSQTPPNLTQIYLDIWTRHAPTCSAGVSWSKHRFYAVAPRAISKLRTNRATYAKLYKRPSSEDPKYDITVCNSHVQSKKSVRLHGAAAVLAVSRCGDRISKKRGPASCRNKDRGFLRGRYDFFHEKKTCEVFEFDSHFCALFLIFIYLFFF